jgi:hypothetical protein
MKATTSVLLAGSLIIAALNIPGAVSAQDDRRYDRDDRYDRRNDRDGNWWEQLTGSRDRRDRDLEGTWYANGDRDKRAEIAPAGRDGYEARNERGQKSRLEITRNGDVRAVDWEGGLRGEVRRDRIEWEKMAQRGCGSRAVGQLAGGNTHSLGKP